jgi:HSF-type DNA-binding
MCLRTTRRQTIRSEGAANTHSSALFTITIERSASLFYVEGTMSHSPPSFRNPNFPEQLHHALTEMAKEGLDHIASWQPHGRCFKIHNPQAFVQTVLGRYVVSIPLSISASTLPKYILTNAQLYSWFHQTKFASFQRQLNIYNFRRIGSGTLSQARNESGTRIYSHAQM